MQSLGEEEERGSSSSSSEPKREKHVKRVGRVSTTLRASTAIYVAAIAITILISTRRTIVLLSITNIISIALLSRTVGPFFLLPNCRRLTPSSRFKKIASNATLSMTQCSIKTAKKNLLLVRGISSNNNHAKER